MVRQAIIVAVDKYEESNIVRLRYATRCAKELKKHLIQLCGFKSSEITMLLGRHATQDRLLRVLQLLGDSTLHEAGDLLWIFFSGHGTTISTTNYIIPYDGTASPVTAEGRNVSVAELLKCISSSLLENRLVFIDACRDRLDSNVMGANSEGFDDIPADPSRNTFIAYATLAGQVGREEDDLKASVFSYHLLRSLRQLAERPSPVLLRDLKSSLSTSMKEYARSSGRKQLPQFVDDERILDLMLSEGGKRYRRASANWLAIALSLLLLAVLVAGGETVYMKLAKARTDNHSSDSQASTDPVELSPSVTGIDISSFNENIDWRELDRSSIKFVFIKASEGATYKSRRFAEYWSSCRKHGILRGAYHYYKPEINGLEQAQNFISCFDGMPLDEYDMFVLDVEKPFDELDVGQIRDWLNAVETFTHKKPIIYTTPNYWDSNIGAVISITKRYPLWVAHYTDAQAPRLPGGWPTYVFWQITDNGTVPGVSGTCDVSRFNGTEDELLKFASLAEH